VPARAASLSPPAAYAPRDPSRTALHALVREQHATFARVACGEGGAPAFVNEAFERFLRCGVLAHGFARFQCSTCKHEHFVPLSCKTRGLCPSCGGRRMMALTRHVLDATLPHVPMRQWVLSLPHALRYRVAYEHGAELHGRLERALRKYTAANLLVIEDFAVLAMDPAQAKLAFQVISERYDHRRSTAVTTNRPFKDWPKVFPDALNAQVIAERLTERSEVFVLDGRRYRVSKT
jgi:DNA-directed RNA polymerase subunit RPC12/RpoP